MNTLQNIGVTIALGATIAFVLDSSIGPKHPDVETGSLSPVVQTVPNAKRTAKEVKEDIDFAVNWTTKAYGEPDHTILVSLVKDCYSLAKETPGKWTCFYMDLIAYRLNAVGSLTLGYFDKAKVSDRANRLLDNDGMKPEMKDKYLMTLQSVLYKAFDEYNTPEMRPMENGEVGVSDVDGNMTTEKFKFEVVR